MEENKPGAPGGDNAIAPSVPLRCENRQHKESGFQNYGALPRTLRVMGLSPPVEHHLE